MSIRIDGTNTTANPGITGSDTDTGLQFGTNEVKVVTDGSDRVTVDSSGRLLAGTTTARSNILDGDGGNTLTPHVQVETANDDTAKALSVIFGRNNSNGAEIVLGKHRNASVGGTTIVNDGDQLGSLTFSGSDGTNFIPAATIEANVDATPGTNDMPGRLVFSTTADGASIPTERMRILSSGGLTFNGDTAQANALNDYEEGTFTPRLVIENSGDVTVYTNKKGSYVKVGSTVTVWFNLTVDGTPSGRSTSNAIEFHDLPFTSTDDGNDGAAMYIGSVRINGVDTGSSYNDMSEAVIRLNPNNTMGRIELREATTSALRNSSVFLKDNTAIFATITYRTDA